MMAESAALAGRILQALADLSRVVDRAELLVEKAQSANDSDYLDGVALNLHGFYAGVERIFEDIARNLEQVIPEGPNWHQDLLLQMSANMPSIRPPVISQQTRYCLDEYRGFRHVVRNVYTFNLRPPRILELTTGLRSCYNSVATDLKSFVQFLEQLSLSSEEE